MEFNINKKASLPVLKLELIEDGMSDTTSFFESIQNAKIVFTMTDVITGTVRIGRKRARLIKILPEDCCGEKFYLGYNFSTEDTSLPGRYFGKFEILFLDGSGTLIVPIREILYINILDGDVKK